MITCEKLSDQLAHNEFQCDFSHVQKLKKLWTEMVSRIGISDEKYVFDSEKAWSDSNRGTYLLSSRESDTNSTSKTPSTHLDSTLGSIHQSAARPAAPRTASSEAQTKRSPNIIFIV